MTIGSTVKQGGEENEGDMKLQIPIEECKTPTRLSNQIPAILTCPPAPRKKKRVSQVRAESSSPYALSFFQEEIEVFFQSMYEFTRANKKCKSI
ncbi:hypothetical protein Lal_00009855 [Lupinus albus]|nr:hypothetical protein Lal_00009855 [Lupinus albus]